MLSTVIIAGCVGLFVGVTIGIHRGYHEARDEVTVLRALLRDLQRERDFLIRQMTDLVHDLEVAQRQIHDDADWWKGN